MAQDKTIYTCNDCGGTCPQCADGRACALPIDCQSAVCDPTAGTCAPASCTDHVKNGAETDFDCGGGTCPVCATGQGCASASDCVSGHACTSGTCS